MIIERLNPDNKIPYYFTDKEVERIFRACSNLKHKAMLSVLFYGALRASELCQLDDSDINLSNLTLRIQHGKGGREGITYINEDCASLLKHYLKVHPPLIIDGRQPLFYTDFGQRWAKTELHRIFAIYKKKRVFFLWTGEYEESVICYDRAIKLNPQFVDVWTDKGNAIDDLGKHCEAIQWYDKAIEINSRHADVFYNKGIALAK